MSFKRFNSIFSYHATFCYFGQHSRRRLIRTNWIRKFVRIIRSDELKVHFNTGSQWSMSKEIVRIRRTVRIISGWIKLCLLYYARSAINFSRFKMVFSCSIAIHFHILLVFHFHIFGLKSAGHPFELEIPLSTVYLSLYTQTSYPSPVLFKTWANRQMSIRF